MKTDTIIGPLLLNVQLEQWPLLTPFRITGYTFESLEVLRVQLEMDGYLGQAEAAGVYYKGDTPHSMLQRIQMLRTQIEAGISHAALFQMLPPGGTRNALDCALWDLKAAITGTPVWQLSGMKEPKPLTTNYTCGADTPEKMAALAGEYSQARAIKLKLTGEKVDADRVRAVRDRRPDVWLSVDANQGFTRPFLERLMPVLVEQRVLLIEQPFQIGQESLLDGFGSPIPIAADETVQSADDIPALVGRFNMINIKLDKCGGLTEAFRMVRLSQELGLDLMVGGMMGTSLATAPAFLIGQYCKVVDLDGSIVLQNDRDSSVKYFDGLIDCPPDVWGYGRSRRQDDLRPAT